MSRLHDFLSSPSPAAVKAGRLAALIAVPAMLVIVLSPLVLRPWTLGEHNWDQMNTRREVVVQTLARFHQFPFWDPYTCGGHPAWGSLESAPIVISPWLPFYLLFPLPIAIRVEIIVSALVGALGAWRLASRFTRSLPVQSLFTVVTVVVNSRWAMQIAAGHTWHLFYGLLPWILYLFDRSIDPQTPRPNATRDVIAAGACLALMVYGDAIYPVPHTAFALVVFALFVARYTCSVRPLVAVAGIAAVAVGLSAPKLLPLFEALQQFPRIIKSDEAIWPQYIPAIFTRRTGDYMASADFVSGGMWHEWGPYLGWPALIGFVAAIFASQGPRQRALKWAGWLMFSFVALAGVHPITPWRILHLLPLFKSQHHPERWLYAAFAVLARCAASGVDQWLRKKKSAARGSRSSLLGFAAVLLALDMGTVSREAIAEAFVHPSPSAPETVGPFHMVHSIPPRSDYDPGLWDVSTLPGVLHNTGTLQCDTDSRLHTTNRDPEGRMPGVGALGDNDPDYRGEAYVAERAASTTVVSFTPNEVEVRVEGAEPGDHVVLNQNWDPGWTADGAPAVAVHDAVGTVVRRGSASIVFRYRPRTLELGLLACALTIAAIAALLLRSRRGAPAAQPEGTVVYEGARAK